MGVKGLANLISDGFDSLCLDLTVYLPLMCKLSVTQRQTLEGENAGSLDLM